MSRQFADVLRDLAGGTTYEDLTAGLALVVEAVQDTRKMGEVSVKLKVKPNGESSVIITDEIKLKAPEATRGETVFFTTAGGNLLRDDPKQDKLPLREVSAPADQTDAREVS